MFDGRMITIVASSITLLGGSVAVSEASPVRAQAAGCWYGYTAVCSSVECAVGEIRTCSSHCTMPECEDYIAYSCCTLI